MGPRKQHGSKIPATSAAAAAAGSADPRTTVAEHVRAALDAAPVHDIHTHLYPPAFGRLCLWGIDELLTYHYLAAEFLRVADRAWTPERFYARPRAEQADLIWRELFVQRSPISEAARGVICCLARLGLDPNELDLAAHRRAFADWEAEDHVDRVLRLSGVESLIMTNDPFDLFERERWMTGAGHDARFHAALRLDGLLYNWPQTGATLRADGYDVEPDLGGATMGEIQRFVRDWIDRIQPLYLAASMPPAFRYPAEAHDARVIAESILPVAAERNLPFAVMIGSRRRVNPRLGLAGDAVGLADMSAVAALCAAHPDNRFLCTVLARENQHELAVIARKFANLHLFGCWWFLNTQGLAEEVTRTRLELLGHSFTPQHSDARVLEQLIYKWSDARAMLARVLTDKYTALAQAGRSVPPEQIRAEVADFLGGSALRFIRGDSSPSTEARLS